MSNMLNKLMVSLMVIVFAASCGGATQLVNEAWMETNAKGLSWDKQQGIILPIDIHGFNDGAKGVLLAGALMGGFAAATLDENNIPRWISLQPAIAIPPFSQNLSHEMSWNVFHMADFHKTWDPTKDIHGSSPQLVVSLVQQLPNAITLGLKMAEEALQTSLDKPDFKIGFEPRFLAGAHIDSAGTTTVMGKGINTADIKAFMYDAKVGEYISYSNWETAMPYTGDPIADKGVLVAKFSTLGGEILGMIIGPLTASE